MTELLDAWVEASPPEGLISELIDSLSGPKCSTDGKRDGLTWLAGAVAAGNAGGDLPGLLKLAVAGSSDKTIDVREAAAKLVTALIEVGAGFLAWACLLLDSLSDPTRHSCVRVQRLTGMQLWDSRPSTLDLES